MPAPRTPIVPSRWGQGPLRSAGHFGAEGSSAVGRGVWLGGRRRGGAGAGDDRNVRVAAAGSREVPRGGAGSAGGDVDVHPKYRGGQLALGNLGLKAKFLDGLGAMVGAVAIGEQAHGYLVDVAGIGHDVGVVDVALLEST